MLEPSTTVTEQPRTPAFMAGTTEATVTTLMVATAVVIGTEAITMVTLMTEAIIRTIRPSLADCLYRFRCRFLSRVSKLGILYPPFEFHAARKASLPSCNVFTARSEAPKGTAHDVVRPATLT